MKSVLLWLVWSWLGVAVSMGGPVFETVAAFQAGPSLPDGSGLIKHEDGMYYGTSRAGGAFGYGTLYRVGAGGEISVMVHFSGNTGSSRGKRPQSGLVPDGAGFLWGTTVQGGTGNIGEGYGTVFRFSPASGSLTTVVEFTGPSGPARGSFPLSGLCWDGAGFMWGTTSAGGAGTAGTIFKVRTATLEFSPVLDFSGMGGLVRGKMPQAPMVYDAGTGWFYGTTTEGGAANAGTVFRMERSTLTFTTLVEFTGVAGSFPGSRPRSGVTLAGGSWWGTTGAGGSGGQGTIFKVAPDGTGFSTVAQFTGAAGVLPGRTPVSMLVPDGNGALWGTTATGGVGEFGTIYKVAVDSGVAANVTTFTGAGGGVPGAVPAGDLLPDGPGAFCGVTNAGGASKLGGVFRITTAPGSYTRIANFVKSLGVANSSNPSTGLAAGPDGLLWGTAEQGGEANAGTVFTVQPETGETKDVVQFTGMEGAVPGSRPTGELTLDGAGNFWGTTANGGAADGGTVFKINALTKVFTTVVQFNGSSGRNPSARVVLDSTGRVWGTTAEGGTDFSGTVFRLDPATGVLTTVVNFSGNGGSFPGDGPLAGLSHDGQGSLWGTTYEGGDSNLGTVFRIHSASGAFTSVFSFTGSEGDFPGDGPTAILVSDGAGFLWGTTGFGGLESAGTVFKVNASTGAMTTLVEFTGPAGDYAGRNPRGSLLRDSTGAWYGTTESGGSQDLGTIFRLAPDGAFSTVFEFTGSLGTTPGEKPKGSLLLHRDGNFYGTTTAGGTNGSHVPAGNGQIFRLRFGPTPATLNAIAIESARATLRGTVNPNGAVSQVGFEYSTTADFVNPVVVSAGVSSSEPTTRAVTLEVTGLQPLIQYFFRLRATNPENVNVQYGAVHTFTTMAGEGGTGTVPFVSWMNGAGISGNHTLAGADSDGDGTANVLEYVFGGNAALQDTVEAPEFYLMPDHLIMIFKRHDRSEVPGLQLGVEAGAGVDSWPVYLLVGATTAASGNGVTVVENGTDPDTVTVQIPRASGVRFARIRAVVTP